MERIKYPYEPGKFGIPFEKIDQFYKEKRKKGKILSGSGRTLVCEIYKNSFGICDSKFQERTMSALVNDGVVTFDLRTKKSDRDMRQKFPWERHPDMFAKKFVGMALQYFGDKGIEINTCRGSWGSFSDNLRAYNHELKKSGDKVKAAKSTWSGQAFIEYGFTQIEEKDIEENEYYIQADFHRGHASRV
jgi:hypothetical protein